MQKSATFASRNLPDDYRLHAYRSSKLTPLRLYA